MNPEIVAALIGGAATVAAAIITVLLARRPSHGSTVTGSRAIRVASEESGHSLRPALEDHVPKKFAGDAYGRQGVGHLRAKDAHRREATSKATDPRRSAALLGQLRQLLKYQDEVEVNRPRLTVVRFTFRLVLVLVSAFFVSVSIYALVDGPGGAHDKDIPILYLVLVCVSNIFYWTLVAMRRKGHNQRVRRVALQVEKIARQFPGDSRAWGGTPILQDRESVREIINALASG